METSEADELAVPDDALVEIRDLAPDLSSQELLYVYWRSLAIPPAESYRRAGLEGKNWRTLERRPAIRKAMEDLQEQIEPDYKVTRKRVQAIILEGIEIARRRDQPKVMIEGALALADIGGLKAPQRLQIQQQQHITHESGSRPQPAQLALAQLSRSDLEMRLGKIRTLPVTRVVKEDVVEAEFTEIEVTNGA